MLGDGRAGEFLRRGLGRLIFQIRPFVFSVSFLAAFSLSTRVAPESFAPSALFSTGSEGFPALFLARPALAAVQTNFEAGISTSAGYDSNVLFNGLGGDGVGRFGLLLKGRLYERLWSTSFELDATSLGFLERQQLVFLGESRLSARRRLDRRNSTWLRARLRAADDPLALAQIGMLGAAGRALSWRSQAGYEHRFSSRVAMDLLLGFDGVHFLDPHLSQLPGGMAGRAGLGASWRLTRILGLSQRLEGRLFFSEGWLAQSVSWQPGVRLRLARRSFLEASAGPVVIFDPQGSVPDWNARARWSLEGRSFGADLVLAKDLSLPGSRGGLISTQLLEGIVRRGTLNTELRLRSGIYRSHPALRDPRWVLGYGLEGAGFVKVLPLVWLGVSAMRFERLASDFEPAQSRNALYLQLNVGAGRP